MCLHDADDNDGYGDDDDGGDVLRYSGTLNFNASYAGRSLIPFNIISSMDS